jgi:hypothetical protein
MNIDPEQAIHRIRVEFERVAENCDTGIHHQHIQCAASPHLCDHRVPVSAVCLDRRAASLDSKRFSCRLGP